MPLSSAPLTGKIVENFFDNLLPDSTDIRKRVAERVGAVSVSPFDLIEKIGRDCVGAIMVLPEGTEAPDVRKIEATPLSTSDIEQLIDSTLHGKGIGYGIEDDDVLQLSIAGAQEKTALIWHDEQWCRPQGATPTTHILKLPLGLIGGGRVDFSSSVENEWICSLIAKAYGLDVAHCDIEYFGKYKALVVERFDRRKLGNWWARLPQEDFCQVLGSPPNNKYENIGGPGMASILDKLRGSAEAQKDRRDFLATQLLFWMLAAPDGHGKNFSVFIGDSGAFQLTPLYDILSAWPMIGNEAGKFQWKKLTLAMAVHGKNVHYKMAEITRRHWSEVARRNNLGSDFEDVIGVFIARTPVVIAEVASQLPPDFPDAVSIPIFEGLLRQATLLESQPPN